jgi:flavin reductase (DIM6/NTAB) family NADH-FMN oxidoreductase RutF
MRYNSVDANLFKQAMSQFASSVAVVTTAYEGQLVGITATSFCSVSLYPPQLLVCIDQERYTCKLIKNSQCFAISILGAQQLAWGHRFAGLQPGVKDRFAGIDYIKAVTDCPILPGSISWFDCELVQDYRSGDHAILVGNVVAAGTLEEDLPLLYHNRTWVKLNGHLSPVLG